MRAVPARGEETQKIVYNYFRTLDPSTGRYLESDPIGLAGGLNTYGYVGGNPMKWSDPYGLKTCVLVTRSSNGFGNHAALWSDGSASTGGEFLFDPAGDYVGNIEGQGEFTDGKDANIKAFEEFHRKKFDDSTEQACIDTTDEEEQTIFNNIMNRGQCLGGLCAACVSETLSGVDRLKTVGSFFPGNLPSQIDRALNPPSYLWEKPTAP